MQHTSYLNQQISPNSLYHNIAGSAFGIRPTFFSTKEAFLNLSRASGTSVQHVPAFYGNEYPANFPQPH